MSVTYVTIAGDEEIYNLVKIFRGNKKEFDLPSTVKVLLNVRVKSPNY